MRGHLSKKLLSMLLASSLAVGSVSVLSSCGKTGGSASDEPVTLDVYSQLANYSGIQTGWSADILLDKFNVKLNIIPEGNGVYDTRAESGDLGDIVVFGSDSGKYPSAVKEGLLYDWNQDNLLEDYGPYIKEHMPDALKKNSDLTSSITDGASDAVYGFGYNVATSSSDFSEFLYTWDIRWDLYKKLGYPEVKDLDDYIQLLKDMKEICPKDESGNPTYAVSLWHEWDDSMVMYVKALATAYWGYDEFGLGLYDPKTGEFHGALEEDGPYIQALKFFNELYRNDLVDPDSMTQTYDNAIEKVKNGGVFTSLFNYSGQLAYNTPEHLEDGTMMYSMCPSEASPILYGLGTLGGSRVWTIGAKSEYPELAMEVINFLSTPEGCLMSDYGPKGVTWDYDEEGNTYFTELGKKCNRNKDTKIGNGFKGSYHDGELQINNRTWAVDATNPESNGETYNSKNWKSEQTEAGTKIEQDWRDKTGCTNSNEYLMNGKYTLSPATSFTFPEKDDELQTTWNQVTKNCILVGSWNAVYAKSEQEFDKIIDNMIKDAKEYGYDKCEDWSKAQAVKRKKAEDALQSTGGSSSSSEAASSSSEAASSSSESK